MILRPLVAFVLLLPAACAQSVVPPAPAPLPAPASAPASTKPSAKATSSEPPSPAPEASATPETKADAAVAPQSVTAPKDLAPKDKEKGARATKEVSDAPDRSNAATGAAAYAGLRPFQREALDAFDADMKGPIEAASKACGAKMIVARDFSAYKEADWEGQSISGRCEAVLSGIASLCSRPHYKPEIAKQIVEVKCLFGGKPGSDRASTSGNMSISGRAFVFRMHPENANLEDVARDIVRKKVDAQ